MKCYLCEIELKNYGKESPLDGERVCDSCYWLDKAANEELDYDNKKEEE